MMHVHYPTIPKVLTLSIVMKNEEHVKKLYMKQYPIFDKVHQGELPFVYLCESICKTMRILNLLAGV